MAEEQVMQLLRTSLMVAAIAFGAAQPAAADEPQLYYFGATGCDYCADGLAFLERLEKSDERIKLRSFDIVSSSNDATAFARVVQAVGLGDPRVPLTVIGHHVIIGYSSDETTGEEIRVMIELCRARTCPDLLGPVIDDGPQSADAGTADAGQPSVVEKSMAGRTWAVQRRYADAAQRR